MSEIIEPLRGMNDVLPDEARWWQRLEAAARSVFAQYGYREIRVPVLERTQLFKRAIGEYTDIVEKEMFTFEDRDGMSLALRPEGTAGIVRAAISNGLLHNQRHRLYTFGPMFRGERPQKGRYRQFHQIDAEAFGYEGPDIDAELILIAARLWRVLGISRVRLEVNSLGTAESRAAYREVLRSYFTAHESVLDADSRRRLGGNPLQDPRQQEPGARRTHRPGAAAHRPPRRRLARALRRALRPARGGRRRLHGEPAPGARPRLLQPDRVRVGHRRARLAECGLLGRPLRRARRPSSAARRRRRSAGRSAWSGS